MRSPVIHPPKTAMRLVQAGTLAVGGASLSERYHWSIVHAGASVATLIVTVFLAAVLLEDTVNNTFFLMMGVLWVSVFFVGFTLLCGSLVHMSERHSLATIFLVAVLARIAAVLIAYVGFESWNGTPFEPYASDSIYYHTQASRFAAELEKGLGPALQSLAYVTPSNLGYVLTAGGIYALCGGDVLAVRLIQAVAGGVTALLLYKVVRLAAGPAPARTAGALCALYPYLVYYTGLHLKETVLNLFIVGIIYLTIVVSTDSGRARSRIALLLGCLIALFFFRTFLAVLMFGAVAAHSLIQSSSFIRRWRRVAIVSSVVATLAIGVGIAQPRVLAEVLGLADVAVGQWERELTDKEQSLGRSIDTDLVSRASFALAGTVGPLPALVSISGQENNLIQYGFAWVRHALLLFTALGLYWIVRSRNRQLTVLLVFLVGYVAIISVAGLPTSHRFQLPTLPAWIAIAALGLHVPLKRRKIASVWILSLIVLGAVTLTWNYLKLALRGV